MLHRHRFGFAGADGGALQGLLQWPRNAGGIAGAEIPCGRRNDLIIGNAALIGLQPMAQTAARRLGQAGPCPVGWFGGVGYERRGGVDGGQPALHFGHHQGHLQHPRRHPRLDIGAAPRAVQRQSMPRHQLPRQRAHLRHLAVKARCLAPTIPIGGDIGPGLAGGGMGRRTLIPRMGDILGDAVQRQRAGRAIGKGAAREQRAISTVIGTKTHVADVGAAQLVQAQPLRQHHEPREITSGGARFRPSQQRTPAGQRGDIFQRVGKSHPFQKAPKPLQHPAHPCDFRPRYRPRGTARLDRQRMRPLASQNAHQTHKPGARGQEIGAGAAF